MDKVSRYFWIGLILLLISSFKREEKPYLGKWKIETVIVEKDTLYSNESIDFTISFYNSNMGGWKKTDSDADYVVQCIRSTYNNLQSVTLEFKRKNYTQSAIIPCWDHILFQGVTQGTFNPEGNSIELLKDDNSRLMILKYDPPSDQIIYFNQDYNYEIIYSRVVKSPSK